MKTNPMKNLIILIIFPFMANTAFAMGNDDPLIATFRLNEFEVKRDPGEDNTLAWDSQVNLSTDLHGLTLESEGERVKGDTEEHEMHLYYSRALSPFWDLQVGWRGDLHPDPRRHWFMVGVEGEAPFFIETEAQLYFGDNGRTALSIEAEKEIMLTQKWYLTPEVTASFHGHNDRETGTGSGLSTLETAIRLVYDVTPQFSPYIGIEWEKKYGNTADFARMEGEGTESTHFLVGIRAWF